MSGKIPSRRERLRRAGQISEQLKDQFGNADDIRGDIREVVDTEDPSIQDYQLPEAIEGLSAETIAFEEQRKAFSAELEALNEEGIELETERHILTKELESDHITDEEPDQSTKNRLAGIKRLFGVDTRLAALVYQDQPLFQDSIRDIRAQGNQLVIKMHHLLEDVQSVKESIRSAKEEYDERLTNLVEPLQQKFHHTKDQLEASKALESSTIEELAKVKQEHQTSEMALQSEIEEHKAEVERLKTDAQASLSHFQTEKQTIESEKGVLSAQNAQQKTTIEALRKSLSQQTVQHDAKVKTMIAEKKDLSDRNDKQGADIKMLEDTLNEIVETLSRQNEKLQANVNDIQADKDTLDTRVIQAETLNQTLQAEKDDLSTRIDRQKARIHTLDVERGDLTSQISEKETRIHDLEVEKGCLMNRNNEHEQHIQALNRDHQGKIELLEASRSNLAEVTKGQELLEQKAAEMMKREELLEQMTAEMTKRGELLDQKTRAINEREETFGRREGTFQHNLESFERLQQEFHRLMTASRSSISSPAINLLPVTRQDLPVNPVSSGRDTIVPSGQGGGSATEPSGLSMASDHVRNVWRQIEFPADWTTADSANLLVKFNEAKERKEGKNNRYWPQQALDVGSKFTRPYCLLKDLKKMGMQAPQDGRRCASHASDDLCINVFYSTDSPGEYNSAATDKRWRLEKR